MNEKTKYFVQALYDDMMQNKIIRFMKFRGDKPIYIYNKLIQNNMFSDAICFLYFSKIVTLNDEQASKCIDELRHRLLEEDLEKLQTIKPKELQNFMEQKY